MHCIAVGTHPAVVCRNVVLFQHLQNFLLLKEYVIRCRSRAVVTSPYTRLTILKFLVKFGPLASETQVLESRPLKIKKNIGRIYSPVCNLALLPSNNSVGLLLCPGYQRNCPREPDLSIQSTKCRPNEILFTLWIL